MQTSIAETAAVPPPTLERFVVHKATTADEEGGGDATVSAKNQATTTDPTITVLRLVARQWYEQILQEEEDEATEDDGDPFFDLAATVTNEDPYRNLSQQKKYSTASSPFLPELSRILNGGGLPTPTATATTAPDLRSGMILTLSYLYDHAVLRQTYQQRMGEQDTVYCTQQVRTFARHAQQQQEPTVVQRPQPQSSPTDVVRQWQLQQQAATSAAASSPNAATPTTQHQHQPTRQILATLFHGKHCRGGCELTDCGRARALWSHATQCSIGTTCPTPLCVTSRRALWHWQLCSSTSSSTSSSCPVCGPVRAHMPQLEAALGHGVPKKTTPTPTTTTTPQTKRKKRRTTRTSTAAAASVAAA